MRTIIRFNLKTIIFISCLVGMLAQEANAKIECSPSQWNQLLAQYHQAEEQYNATADEFNHLFKNLDAQPLLHQKMSFDGLVALWHPFNSSVYPELEKRIEDAQLLSESLLRRSYEMNLREESLNALKQGWDAFTQSCSQQAQQQNKLSGQTYSNHTQTLIQDFNTLDRQLRLLSTLYLQEATSIKNARKTARSIQN